MSPRPRGPDQPVENLAVGTVIEVDGSRIIAELSTDIAELTRVFGGVVYPIGRFGSIMKIHYGSSIIYAMVSRLRMKAEYEQEMGLSGNGNPSARVVEADLFGEGRWVRTSVGTETSWHLKFQRGVSTYPLPQQTVYLTPESELAFVFGRGTGATIRIGEHVGSGGTPAYADLNELLGKHTAVLGSTGAGKSGTVAAILHSILDHGERSGYDAWDPRILILDPHDEYGSAFADHHRLSTDEGTLCLPFWLLNLQETLALILGKTEFVATSQANILKAALLQARKEGARDIGIEADGVTVDSPVPYSLGRLVAMIEDDKPPQPSKQGKHNAILNKLEILRNDSRLSFLLTEWDGRSDPFPEVVMQFMGPGSPVRVVDLSGVPNEVAGAASSAIARTIFSVKLWQTPEERQATPVLVVCEEAHRYVPNRGEALYEAAQEAIRRLAKEGRKYGIGLMLVSQRPSEVEATVLSQCNSWLVLRITNEEDRSRVRAVLPDSLAGLTAALSGLRRREAIFVGQGTPIPSRILVRHLVDEDLPKSSDIDFDSGWKEAPVTEEELSEVATRWRFQRR